ncbi:hypothetical protein ACLB2K_064415 [Fragaria x ananassa]
MPTENKGSLPLLVINYLLLFVGSVSSSLLSKYYFVHGCSNLWVSTWVQSAGFPLLLPPIILPYFLNRTTRRPFTHFTPKIFFISIFVGLMLGLNNLLFSVGNSNLPVSTFSLILSSHLVFNLVLSVVIVKQKVTFSNLNCVILLTFSTILVALDSSPDKHGLTHDKYLMGFLSTVGAGLLFALYLPVMEKIYRKVNCYTMMMEMQVVMEAAATALSTAFMVYKGAFGAMVREGREVFDKGESLYWWTVVFNVVTWQLCFMGTAGMVFLTTSLTGGICMTALMGMNVLGGVLVYGDRFGGVKVVSTLLCVWGFCSYVYGIYIKSKNDEDEDEDRTDDEMI